MPVAIKGKGILDRGAKPASWRPVEKEESFLQDSLPSALLTPAGWDLTKSPSEHFKVSRKSQLARNGAGSVEGVWGGRSVKHATRTVRNEQPW